MDVQLSGHTTRDVAALQQQLAADLRLGGYIQSPAVESAFRHIPRHMFLLGVPAHEAYINEVIVTKHVNAIPVSSSSQPALMATMLEQLELKPGQRVMEIGAGTGFNAALMGHIVGPHGRVVAIDIDADIVENAQRNLAAVGVAQVQAIQADGGLGYPPGAPYDRILLAVAAGDITPAWREQLKPNGILVIPWAVRGVQRSLAFELRDDHFVSRSVVACDFVALRGAFAGASAPVPVGPEPGVFARGEDCEGLEGDRLYRLLTGSHADWRTPLRVTPFEILDGLSPWLALRNPSSCILTAEGEVADRGLVPYLFGNAGSTCLSGGLLEDDTLCMLMRPPDHRLGTNTYASAAFPLYIRSFGPNRQLVRRLIEQITAWDAAGRPTTDRMRVKAYPQAVGYQPAAHERCIDRPSMRFVIDWA